MTHSEIMVDVLNQIANRHGLSVRLVMAPHGKHKQYEVSDSKGVVYEATMAEEIEAYIGRIVIAKRFAKQRSKAH